MVELSLINFFPKKMYKVYKIIVVWFFLSVVEREEHETWKKILFNEFVVFISLSLNFLILQIKHIIAM